MEEHPDRLLSVAEFCKMIGICRRTFDNMRARGEAPPSVKFGNRRGVRASTAAAWLKSREAQ